MVPIAAFVTGLPTWVKLGAAAGLVIGVLELRHWWTTRDLRRDLAKQEQLLKQEQETAAKANAQRELERQQEEQNRQALEADIANQNRRIAQIAAQARQAQTAAALAALREVRAGEASADELRKPSTDIPRGPDGMNTWLRARVGVTP